MDAREKKTTTTGLVPFTNKCRRVRGRSWSVFCVCELERRQEEKDVCAEQQVQPDCSFSPCGRDSPGRALTAHNRKKTRNARRQRRRRRYTSRRCWSATVEAIAVLEAVRGRAVVYGEVHRVVWQRARIKTKRKEKKRRRNASISR